MPALASLAGRTLFITGVSRGIGLAIALRAAADGVVERRWEPLTVLETHTHPFSARALVVQGEMWLTRGSQTQHLRPGDRFELWPGVPHDERYGPEGATYWVARHGGV